MTPANAAARLAIIVHHPKWAGGVHRDHAAELLGVSRSERVFDAAIAIAYRLGQVDVCEGYLVAPARPGSDEVRAA